MRRVILQPTTVRGRLVRAADGVWHAHLLGGRGRIVARHAIGRDDELGLPRRLSGVACMIEVRPSEAPWRRPPVTGSAVTVVPTALQLGGARIPITIRQEKAVAALQRVLAREALPRLVFDDVARCIGLWRSVRDRLRRRVRGGPLVSLGAGPRLDLMGWCFDRPWDGPVFAADAKPWQGILDDPDWRLATDWLVGEIVGPHVDVAPHPGDLPDDATVLAPLAALEPLGASLSGWLRKLTGRGCRLVIVDGGERVERWPATLAAAGAPELERTIYRCDAAIRALDVLYRPSGRTPRHDRLSASVLVFLRGRWRFVSAQPGSGSSRLRG